MNNSYPGLDPAKASAASACPSHDARAISRQQVYFFGPLELATAGSCSMDSHKDHFGRSLSPDQEDTSSPRTMDGHSATGTMEPLPSQSSSSASSSSELSTGGDTGSRSSQRTRSVISGKIIRKRPKISDLQYHNSTSKIPNEQHPARQASKHPSPTPKRRCISANAAILFTTPDRYVPHRPQLGEKSSSYRTNKPPSVLRGHELYTRTRDHSGDPFRSSGAARADQAVQRQRANNTYRLRHPQITPSFVHGVDAGPFNVEPRPGAESLRQLSWGGFWTVGGRGASYFGQLYPVSIRGGDMLASGTNAPMHSPAFLDTPNKDDLVKAHEGRLALALDIDQAVRILDHSPRKHIESPTLLRSAAVRWEDGSWIRPHHPKASLKRSMPAKETEKNIPSVAFRVLDAPHLKDDFYCSVLAYSFTSRTLATALTHKVYLWTEEYGVQYPPLPNARAGNFVTSLAFSSTEGGKSILAVARHDGNVTLWSLLEPRFRFEAPHPFAACCVAWRPVLAYRTSCRTKSMVPCEDLLVGDDNGRIYYYSVEWADFESGAMTLLVKLDAHSQNVCGLAWAPTGDNFVSGGNDNIALLFHVGKIFQAEGRDRESTVPGGSLADGSLKIDVPPLSHSAPESIYITPPASAVSVYFTPPTSPNRNYIRGVHPNLDLFELPTRAESRHSLPATPPHSPPNPRRTSSNPPNTPQSLVSNQHMPRGSPNKPHSTGPILQNALANPSVTGKMNMHTLSFYHAAAVKAIAFAQWQPSLLATSGGSNDRQIHFYHAGSGSTLALVNVFAQVTSLTWSTTRREIVATFGYAQPEHEIRIAVFSWPSCECVISIPWERKFNGEIGRALWAIPYPGGPNDAVPTRRQSTEGFAAWEAVRVREARRRRRELQGANDDAHGVGDLIRGRPPSRSEQSPASIRRRERQSQRERDQSRTRSRLRAEGETWGSRTEDEGSLIIACCDQTVKFFEVWPGKSKGKGYGLGSKAGVLGGSKVLEGWCEGVSVEEVESSETIR